MIYAFLLETRLQCSLLFNRWLHRIFSLLSRTPDTFQVSFLCPGPKRVHSLFNPSVHLQRSASNLSAESLSSQFFIMIKRMKWNILYSDDENTNRYSGAKRSRRSYESNEDESSSSGSDDSVQVGSKEADIILERLAKNDPNLYPNLHEETSTVHSNDNNSDDDNNNAGHENENCNDVDDSQSAVKPERFIYDKYCSLCPGKRMLNESDIKTHLSSKHHLAAVRKHNKQKQHNHKGDNDNQHKDAETINKNTANDTAKTPMTAHAKRKKRQKIKLQCLAKRKRNKG